MTKKPKKQTLTQRLRAAERQAELNHHDAIAFRRDAELLKAQIERERPQLVALQQANDALTERLLRIRAQEVSGESPREADRKRMSARDTPGETTAREMAQNWADRAEGGAQQHHLVGLAWKLVRHILRFN